MSDVGTAVPPTTAPSGPKDRRGSWIPTFSMISTRFMELRRRRGLMIVLIVVNIGIPSVFLAIRLIAHAVAPKSYGPAGGYVIYTALVAGVMYIFGFIVAATLGCTAGSVDLTEGMFRHLVVTGRSRLALYLARIPAGLAIIVPLVAAGFAIVCAVCTLAAPTTLSYDGATVPAGLSLSGFESWAGAHADLVLCDLPSDGRLAVNIPCGPNGPVSIKRGPVGTAPTPALTPPSRAALSAEAVRIAKQDYADYSDHFLSPSVSLMIKSGLWIELEAAIGLIVGLGLASLLGQRTVSVILMIVLELVLTPILSTAHIAHLINLQRGLVGLATAHLEPASLPVPFGGGGGGAVHRASQLVPESIPVAICVVVAWLVGWSAIGAWRMMTRDA